MSDIMIVVVVMTVWVTYLYYAAVGFDRLEDSPFGKLFRMVIQVLPRKSARAEDEDMR